MTPEERVQKIQKAREKFFNKVEELKKQYQTEVRKLGGAIDKRKMDHIRKELGI